MTAPHRSATLVSKLAAPRTVCLMVPLAAVDGILEQLLAPLSRVTR